jgi:peptide/nickel transport system substrate-binding protein
MDRRPTSPAMTPDRPAPPPCPAGRPRKLRFRRTMAIVAVALTALLAAACSSSKADTSSGGPGGGGNVTVVSYLEPANLDPGEAGTSSKINFVLRSVLQSLVDRDPATHQIVPLLALSWANPTPTTWQFQLRHGVTFQDGTPFNASTAAASLKYIWNPNIDGSGNYVTEAATFTAAGPYTLDVKLASPDPVFLSKMTQVPIASPTQIAKDPNSLADKAIGTGPYEFVSWTRGQDMKFKLYDKSWMAAPGMFDTITWVWQSTPSIQEQMIATGQADVAVSSGIAYTAQECEAVKSAGGTCANTPSTQVNYLRLDEYNQTLLGNQDVRQAIAYAVDRAAINDAFYLGVPVANNIVTKGGVGYSTTGPTYPYDPAKAKSLLAEASAAGVNLRAPITIYYETGNGDTQPDVAQEVAANLQAVGLKVKLDGVTATDRATEYFQNRGSSTYKDIPPNRAAIWVAGTGMELLDFSQADLALTCTGSTSVYCDPAVDAAFTHANDLAGAARNTALVNLWNKLYTNVALLPLNVQVNTTLYDNRVQSFTARPDGVIPFWQIRAKQ